MPVPIALQDALQEYDQSLKELEDVLGGNDRSLIQQLTLATLLARDAVQVSLEKASSISAEQFLHLQRLDKKLKEKKGSILQKLPEIDTSSWRSLINASEDAWWWIFEPPALFSFLEKQRKWLSRFDWLWAFLSLFFLTWAVTVVFDTLNRVVGEGLNTQGIFPVVVQVLLTIAGGSAALTKNGRDFLKSFMGRLRIPQHYWQEFRAIASLIILLIVIGIHELYLPKLAADRYRDGLSHYQAGRFDSALQAYKQSMALRPDFVAGHYSLGLIYEGLQRTEDAISEYQLVVSQDRDALDKLTWLRAHNNLGRLYLLDEEYPTAWIPLERAFNSITEADLTDSEMQVAYYNLLKNLGWLWLAQEQFIEADEFLTQAIDKNPQRSAAHCLKAQVLEGLEQPDEAFPFWVSCLSGERNIQAEEAEWAAMARAKLEAAE